MQEEAVGAEPQAVRRGVGVALPTEKQKAKMEAKSLSACRPGCGCRQVLGARS